ncbi:MAG: histidinol-phosphate transaminase [Melioribacter sp.]|nr:histidinol-phosphate transaminase [Melioribacter sp.]
MNIENLVRKNILSLNPYVAARHSHLSGTLMDANENPYGSVIENDSFELNRYPDPNQVSLRKAVSELISIPVENICFGVGSDELIDLFIKIFCDPRKDAVIICEPTYGMYRVCCNINDVNVKNIPLNSNYDIDYDALSNAIDYNTKLIFLCSPNNPSANLLNSDFIINLANRKNVMIVVDEAYIDFAQQSGLVNEAIKIPNLAVIRTFSKAWGMAGVRCGYSVASQFVTELLLKVKAPYNINKLTSDFVIRAISNKERYENFVDIIIKERKRIIDKLSKMKKVRKVLPSDANFISFFVDEPQKVFKVLEENGIVIRDRSNQFNFSGGLRVSVGTEEENNRFLKELEKALI